jgi:hypothetical protein
MTLSVCIMHVILFVCKVALIITGIVMSLMQDMLLFDIKVILGF